MRNTLINLAIIGLIVIPVLMFITEYELVSTDQVKYVINSTLPVFSLTSISAAVNKTGDIGYGYFWVYALSYAIFYAIYFFMLIGLAFTIGSSYSKPIPAKIQLISFVFVACSAVVCFILREPYLDNAFHLFRPNISGAIYFGLILSGGGFFSMIYVLQAIRSFKNKLQGRN